MPVDQAAGLRRRLHREQAQVISLFSAQALPARMLAQAMQNLGKRVLLLDITGRQLDASRTRALFDWRQQIARKHLQPIPMHGIDVIRASGAPIGAAAFIQSAVGYDGLIFDAGELHPDGMAFDLDTAQTLILDVEAHHESVCNSYALIKTLHERKAALSVMLCGDARRCERIEAAAGQFLGGVTGLRLPVKIDDNVDYGALAARIALDTVDEAGFTRTQGEHTLKNG